MNYHKITYPDIENGTGCRVTLWVAGCPHHCLGCHNPETWPLDSGKLFTSNTAKELYNILQLPYIQGITFSGGDPLTPENLNVVTALMMHIKKYIPNKDIWVYTGYTWEYLIEHEEYADVLNYADIIVEGPFILSQRNITLAFKGSTNQRIIDVQKSIASNKLIEYNTY